MFYSDRVEAGPGFVPGSPHAAAHSRRYVSTKEEAQTGAIISAIDTDSKVSRSVLGSWVGVRRLFRLSLFLTASRMVLPQDPRILVVHRDDVAGGPTRARTASPTARSSRRPVQQTPRLLRISYQDHHTR